MNNLVLFEEKQVRRVWHEEEWWFVITDVVTVLTDSVDPSQYLKRIRQRDPQLNEIFKGGVQFVHTLKVQTSGALQNMNCVNTEGAFRILKSIPSPKAEPFKLWLAKTGYERIPEIENLELGQDRIKKYYELKGYSKDWIDNDYVVLLYVKN